MTLVIDTKNLKKAYGEKIAVRNLTLEVPEGEIFGFLGPNGAGKTTAIKMMLGLVKPSDGSAKILGAAIGDVAIRSQIGFLPEHFRFHDWLTGEEFLYLHGQLLGMPGKDLRLRINELLDRVGMTDYRHRYLRTYSKGMLQRVGLAQSLLNRPCLVFLDEPTSGLDPVGRRMVRDIIRELRQDGTTVFLNSHLLSEIEITCNRVAFIKDGEVILTSELKSLMQGQNRAIIHANHVAADTLTGLEQFGSGLMVDGEMISLVIPDQSILPTVVRFLVDHGADIFNVTMDHQSLEDIFIRIIGTDGSL